MFIRRRGTRVPLSHTRRILLLVLGICLGAGLALLLLVLQYPGVEAQYDDVAHMDESEMNAEQAASLRQRGLDDMFALFPSKQPHVSWQPAEGIEECWIETADKLKLHAWYVRHDQPKAYVLYAHGNAGNLTHRVDRAEQMRDRYLVSVFLFDYRGYGQSEGRATLNGLRHDTFRARDYLCNKEGLETGEVVLLGESIGGAFCVELAAADGARGLILENAFSSLRDVAARHYPRFLVNRLVRDRLNSESLIGKYQGPLLQCHGDRDSIIPFALGKKLFDAANEPKRLVIMPGHDHNDPLPEVYLTALGHFFDEIGNQAP
jgi:uncharacterized protein